MENISYFLQHTVGKDLQSNSVDNYISGYDLLLYILREGHMFQDMDLYIFDQYMLYLVNIQN